jgi:hypothetical protein
VLGTQHPLIFQIINSLGSLYTNQGKPIKAGQIYRQVLQGKEKALGVEHILTLNTVHSLWILYRD